VVSLVRPPLTLLLYDFEFISLLATAKRFSSTVRAVDPFGQPFRPTGVQLPGWDFAFFAVGLSGFVKCVGMTLDGFPSFSLIRNKYKQETAKHLRPQRNHQPTQIFSQRAP